MLVGSTRARRRQLPRCASVDGRSVLDFCRELITTVDNSNQTTALGCPNPDDTQSQRVVSEDPATSRTLLVILIVAVVLTVFMTAACLGLCRRNARQCGRRRYVAGTTRRNGYRMVGETAMDFTDVQSQLDAYA